MELALSCEVVLGVKAPGFSSVAVACHVSAILRSCETSTSGRVGFVCSFPSRCSSVWCIVLPTGTLRRRMFLTNLFSTSLHPCASLHCLYLTHSDQQLFSVQAVLV